MFVGTVRPQLYIQNYACSFHGPHEIDVSVPVFTEQETEAKVLANKGHSNSQKVAQLFMKPEIFFPSHHPVTLTSASEMYSCDFIYTFTFSFKKLTVKNMPPKS